MAFKGEIAELDEVCHALIRKRRVRLFTQQAESIDSRRWRTLLVSVVVESGEKSQKCEHRMWIHDGCISRQFHILQDTLKETQASVEATLLKVLIPSEPYPSPGRPLRNLAARCLLVLYHCGESRSLFDTLRVLLKPASDIKATDKDSTRMSA
jgi:hypothetical protein